MTGEKHDVVVIGGGHNGLIVAAYMAKAGLDVCVLEGHCAFSSSGVEAAFRKVSIAGVSQHEAIFAAAAVTGCSWTNISSMGSSSPSGSWPPTSFSVAV